LTEYFPWIGDRATQFISCRRCKAILAVLQKGFRRMAVEGSIAIDRVALVKQDLPDASFRMVSDAARGVRA